ncbi:hypothetical protein, partial [Sunxiuqinia sp. sy24]|uniref:hypothetical protein n=1 Tax=Sunxiuqinia sp. sy24 TaxID=3461495 RepID=UPI004045B252
SRNQTFLFPYHVNFKTFIFVYMTQLIEHSLHFEYQNPLVSSSTLLVGMSTSSVGSSTPLVNTFTSLVDSFTSLVASFTN